MFGGRIDRTGYLIGLFCVYFAILLLMFMEFIAPYLLARLPWYQGPWVDLLNSLSIYLFGFGVILVFIVSTSLSIRRSHDLNMSGWLSLGPGVGPLLIFSSGSLEPNEYGPAQAPRSLGVILLGGSEKARIISETDVTLSRQTSTGIVSQPTSDQSENRPN